MPTVIIGLLILAAIAIAVGLTSKKTPVLPNPTPVPPTPPPGLVPPVPPSPPTTPAPVPPPPFAPELGNVYGKVTDRITGQALSGAGVMLGAYVTGTDMNGDYKFLSQNPGLTTLRVEKPEYAVFEQDINIVAGQNNVDVKLTSIRQGVDVDGFYIACDFAARTVTSTVRLANYTGKSLVDGGYNSLYADAWFEPTNNRSNIEPIVLFVAQPKDTGRIATVPEGLSELSCVLPNALTNTGQYGTAHAPEAQEGRRAYIQITFTHSEPNNAKSITKSFAGILSSTKQVWVPSSWSPPAVIPE